MNKHDQIHKEGLIQTLCKAKEQAGAVKVYLIENNRDSEDIFAASLALEHVEIALEHLGAQVPEK
ncbi:hypothetical protein [Paenibacillus radicis (ex Xue et al. 2023)]|uniref:Uncharacterized protein n=1 Tax=Paenibacillus radicis (ex Xue et al. 2023) TaxID=2972489 RepID=A0ABT1YSU0_9BACL|nr:hypothetical protein [Paenibacillus radicis (ex Xue et al. 2023)]MCR8635765.1 hypothetical protein [Paenibacillus radicis (ex Xue et al. 2023)]